MNGCFNLVPSPDYFLVFAIAQREFISLFEPGYVYLAGIELVPYRGLAGSLPIARSSPCRGFKIRHRTGGPGKQAVSVRIS